MNCTHCDANVEGRPRICPECGRALSTSSGDDRQGGDDDGWGFDNERNSSRDGWNSGDRERESSSGNDTWGGGSSEQGGDGWTEQGGDGVSERADEPLLQDTKDKLDFPVKFPQSGGWRPVGMAGLMLLLSFLVVPLFILIGYCSRVCRAAARGAREAPAFDDWGGLLKEGVLFSVAGAGFMILIAAVVAVLVALGAATGATEASLLIIPLYFFAIYSIRAVLTLYAVTLDFGAAFSPSNVWSLAFTAEYFVTFLSEILLTIALGFVAGFAVLTVVGWIWVYAYIFVATGALWGLFFYDVDTSGLDLPTDEDSVDGALGAPA